MLIIGHRGARGLAPENTLESLQAGFDADADILELDVRLTKDRVAVMVHDSHILRTHKKASLISRTDYKDLKRLPGPHAITRIEEVLDRFYGKVLLNIEIKSKGAGKIVASALKNRHITAQHDWDNILFSSFKASELKSIRDHYPKANIALLHNRNPFAFMAYHRSLHFTAIGFHRLYAHQLAIETAKKLGIFTYAYTVNRQHTAKLLAQKGIDGIVTDYPDRFASLQKHE